MNRTLPSGDTKAASDARKEIPMFTGLVKYFSAALAGVAIWSKIGNDKHNKGEPLHHARGKSMDHEDCIVRHLVDIADLEAYYDRNPHLEGEAWDDLCNQILDEARAQSWRSLALSQRLHEKFGGAPLAPGARLPEAKPSAHAKPSTPCVPRCPDCNCGVAVGASHSMTCPQSPPVDLRPKRQVPLHQRTIGSCECGDPNCDGLGGKKPSHPAEPC